MLYDIIGNDGRIIETHGDMMTANLRKREVGGAYVHGRWAMAPVRRVITMTSLARAIA